MPWKEQDVVSQRIEFVVRAVKRTESISKLCREYGISRETGHQWLKRFEKAGSFSALLDQSRRPCRSPQETSAQVEEQVVQLRRQTGWGGKKNQDGLKQEQGLKLSARTINRIVKRKGLIHSDDQPNRATQRFQRTQPNELWQMDFKGHYPTNDGKSFPLSILEDHSRYVVGLYPLRHPDLGSVERRLMETIQQYGVPEAMLMDHGTPWWGSSNEYGLSRLSVNLIEQGVRLIYSGIGHPQTQGKVERFHRTLKRSLRYRGVPRRFHDWEPVLKAIQQEYNHRRPHEALNMARPAQRYQVSARRWLDRPSEWEYPHGSEVRRLNRQGAFFFANHYRYVSLALAGRQVRLERAADKVLVIYRHMVVRELDLTMGQTKTFVYPLTE